MRVPHDADRKLKPGRRLALDQHLPWPEPLFEFARDLTCLRRIGDTDFHGASLAFVQKRGPDGFKDAGKANVGCGGFNGVYVVRQSAMLRSRRLRQ